MSNMSNNNAKSFVPVIYVAVVAGLLLCLVTQLANSAATSAAPRKDANQKVAPSRPEELAKSEGATGKGRRATAAKESQQVVGSNKFQARMGSDQQHQQLGQMNQPQDTFYTSYDSWNPHSLVPTFTDAEQGDEMVALASDSEAPSAEQYIRPPSHSNVTRSASEGSHPQRQQGAPKQFAQTEHRYPLDRPPVAQASAHMSPFDKQRQLIGNQAVANKQRQQQQQQQQQHNHAQSDEYYTDDDEDEEDSIKGLRGDFESFGQQQQQQQRQPQQDRKELKFRAAQQPADMDSHQYTDAVEPTDPRAVDQQQQQGYRVPDGAAMELAMVNNRSQVSGQQTKQLGAPTPDVRWLPSSRDTQAGSSLNLEPHPSAATSQQQFASEQQRLRDPQIQQPSRDSPGSSERMPKLFGGRGDSVPFSPFSKTDAAIEYLRNLLKTKQSSRSNNSTMGATAAVATTIPSGDLPPQATIDAPTSKQQQQPAQLNQGPQSANSFQRLSSFASKLSQMLNSTQPLVGPNQNSSATTETGKPDYLSPYPPQDLQLSNSGTGGRFIPVMVGQQQQTDTKFSVVDAKAAAAQSSSFKPADGFYQAGGQLRTISTSTTTSKPPPQPQLSDELGKHSQPELPIFQAEPSKPEPYSQEPLSPANTPNGTPLGGDYIESLDDFPRGQRQQQVFPSESRLVPVHVQQDSGKAKPEQATELVGENGGLGQSIKQVDQTVVSASKQLQTMNQINPLHFDRESFEAFQRQISGVPSSSHYFQMHKPQSAPDRPSNSNTSTQPEGRLDSNVDSARGQPAKDETQIAENSKPTNHHHNQQNSHYVHSEPALASANQVKKSQSPKIDEQKRQQVIAHHERPKQNMGPGAGPDQQRPAISSKIYPNYDQHQTLSPHLLDLHQQHQSPYPQPHPQSTKQQPPVAYPPVPDALASAQFSPQPESQKIKPPKIVSYNYFESPTETGESELMTTNYQLGDTLYSSAGGAEQTLSNAELEAIQNQFLTAEHPLVQVDSHLPPGDQAQFGKEHHQQHHNHHHNHRNHHQQIQASSQHEQDQSLTGLLASLKPNLQPDMLQKLSSPANQMEEAMKELASNGDLVSVAAPPQPPNMLNHHQQAQQQYENGPMRANEEVKRPASGGGGGGKSSGADQMKNKKSLIVYLNHPRPTDMSKVSSSPDETYSLSQTIGDPQSEPFIAAKEFDIHGLSKAPKHLDISNLRDSLQDSKDSKDKDGLSVVVIGDAYKYKKIVLLISSKSGGLKFIPMVKDMKRKK